MPYEIKGRNVLVTGGSRGLGALICIKFAEAGANVAVSYVSNKARAEEVAERVRECGGKAVCLQGDAGIPEDNARVVKEAHDQLHGLDIIVANAAWTRFAKFGDLHDLSLDEWNKCWATNVMSHVQNMQVAQPIFEKNEDGGCYIITSSIAGVSQSGSSMGYSVTKAACNQLMKCLASTQGPKTRVNAVLPGLLLTEWGLRYSEDRIKGLKERAALKDVTNLDDCAEAYVSIAKNKSMTGQEIIVDSGLKIGVS